MNRSVIAVLFFALLACAACRTPVSERKPAWERLPLGLYVEAEGQVVAGRPVVSEVDEKESEGTDHPGRYEVTGEVESHDGARGLARLLDHEFRITGETSFEDENKKEVEPFQIEPGSWIKAKLVVDPDEGIRARVIRKAEPGNRFEVEGPVSEVRPEPPGVRIGGIWLGLEAGTDVTFLAKEKERTARAEELLEGPVSPLTLFQQDEQKGTRFSIQPRDDLFLGGQLFGRVRGRDEYDLNRDRDRDDVDFTGEVKGDVLWGFDDHGSFALFEVSARTDYELEDGRDNEKDSDLNLSRAYAYWVLGDRFRLQAGRQDFDEEREWLYDDRLDGVRFHYRGSPVEVEVSMSSGRKVLNRKNPQEDILTFISLARYRLDDDHHLSAYVIDRRDRGDADFSPFHFGVRSYGRPSRGLRHWLEISRADGTDGDRDIDGYGIDWGLSYVLDHDLRPAVTVGWALGSGDRYPADRKAPFRQTGLQDNNARFGGVTSFRYYGELYDPELSNLEVLTLGTGFRPVRDASIDLIAHTYRQDWKSSEKGINDLKRAPNGRSRDLGWEVDLVFGYRWDNTINLELILAHFDPGRAFDERDAANLAQVQVRYKF